LIEPEAAVPAPPEGFVPAPVRGGFAAHNGPFFVRDLGGEVVERAVYGLPRHCNGLGLIHGGLLSALMDMTLGDAVIRAVRQRALTGSLSVDYLRMTRPRCWIIAEAWISRRDDGGVHAEGRARVAGREVARATGVFRLMGAS